jgi:general secretion pathway protein G
MKRSGFTMIELIFVIVILGILAAVAIPKLAATRDDAKLSAEMTSVTQALQNLGAEYTAQGAFTNYTVVNATGSVNCFTFTEAGVANDGNVTITAAQKSKAVCPDTMFAIVKTKATDAGLLGTNAAAKVHTLGGESVKL